MSIPPLLLIMAVCIVALALLTIDVVWVRDKEGRRNRAATFPGKDARE